MITGFSARTGREVHDHEDALPRASLPWPAVEIMGKPMDRSTRREHLGRIGSLIESPPGYGHLTGRENMRIIQRLSV